MSCADSSRATPAHARYHARRQRAGDRHRAVVPRARASAAAPPPPVAARPLPHEPSRWVAHRRPAAAVPSGGAEMPIEAAHGAAAAACATLPAASSYPRTLPRPCRAPGATLRRRKRLLQRQRDHIADIQPPSRLLNNIYCPAITPGLALHSIIVIISVTCTMYKIRLHLLQT